MKADTACCGALHMACPGIFHVLSMLHRRSAMTHTMLLLTFPKLPHLHKPGGSRATQRLMMRHLVPVWGALLLWRWCVPWKGYKCQIWRCLYSLELFVCIRGGAGNLCLYKCESVVQNASLRCFVDGAVSFLKWSLF